MKPKYSNNKIMNIYNQIMILIFIPLIIKLYITGILIY